VVWRSSLCAERSQGDDLSMALAKNVYDQFSARGTALEIGTTLGSPWGKNEFAYRIERNIIHMMPVHISSPHVRSSVEVYRGH
jgi:hypothetical protein